MIIRAALQASILYRASKLADSHTLRSFTLRPSEKLKEVVPDSSTIGILPMPEMSRPCSPLCNCSLLVIRLHGGFYVATTTAARCEEVARLGFVQFTRTLISLRSACRHTDRCFSARATTYAFHRQCQTPCVPRSTRMEACP